jgi:HemY protein
VKKSLLVMLLIIVIAGYLGTLISRDPGYVLVTYSDYSLQTSLWIMLALLATFSLAVYLSLRLYGMLRRSGSTYQHWRMQKKVSRASRLTEKGLVLLAEGEFERARKFLDSGADNNTARGLNYLEAARAANAMGDNEARETYLRQAEDADVDLARARLVVTAELALERHDPEAALRALKGTKANKHISHLMHQALEQKNDWRDLMAALPELRKSDKDRALRLEKTAAITGMQTEAGNDVSVNDLFKSLSTDLKKQEDVVQVYVRSLQNKAHAEAVLRATIRKNWQPSLVELYGDSDEETLARRRKTAEGWLKQHKDDASLQFCLGRIYETVGEKNLARQAFTACIDLGGTHKANERLANLLAESGEFERSNQQLRLAMNSTTAES